MPFGASRLGFWYLRPKTGGLDCSEWDMYIPTSANSWSPISSSLQVNSDIAAVIDNGFIKYSVNTSSNKAGSLASIKYDSTGTSNYGSNDYVTPGTPWEGFSFKMTPIGLASYYFAASNVGTSDITPATTTKRVWKISNNHFVIQYGNQSQGFATIQIKTNPGESVIRFQTSYTNTTDRVVSVWAMRGLDPDQDQPGTYVTRNYRGYGSIPVNDLVVAEGVNYGKDIAIYNCGCGKVHTPTGGGYSIADRDFQHNNMIISDWPNHRPDVLMGYSTDSVTSDYGIGSSWYFDNVPVGVTVSSCCYYIMSMNINQTVAMIAG